MLIIDENKLEQSKMILQRQKEELDMKIKNAVKDIVDQEMRIDVEQFLENKYYTRLKDNEQEIAVIEYIKEHQDIVNEYIKVDINFRNIEE